MPTKVKSGIFATVLQSLLPFAAHFEGKTRAVPNPSWSLYKVNLLLSKSFSSASNSGSSSPSAMIFLLLFAALPCFAKANNKR